MSEHRPVHVTGGSGGIGANLIEVLLLAGAFGRAYEAIDDARSELQLTLCGPMAAGFGPFDDVDLGTTVGLLDVRMAADAALDALWLAGLLAGAIRDGLAGAFHRYLFGEDTITSLISAAGRIVHSVAVGQATLVAGGDPGRTVMAQVTDDPDDYFEIAHASPFGWSQDLLEDISYDRGLGLAIPTGTDSTGVAGRPPRHLDDLVADLAQRNGDHRHGEIDVRVLTMPDGTRNVIVDITGTKTWAITDHDPTDLRANIVAMNGNETAYEKGVLAAMRQAGVTASDDVMIVGHSQGGMIAVNAAAHLARTREFRVTHVLTVGAPIGRGVRHVSDRTQVLALEDRSDVVPVLDHRENPDRANVTTAVTDHGDGTIGGDHDLDRVYVPAARDVEASRQRSLRHVLGSMHGYFGATSVTTHTYQVRRV